MVDISNVPFTEVPEEEQAQFASKTKELGEWKGYKPRQYWVRRCIPMKVATVNAEDTPSAR